MTSFQQRVATVVPTVPQQDKKADIEQGRSKKAEETYKPRVD